ncbi:hypothetical protein BH23DEI1_BH23DEI1_11500 [soil metagenome]
MVAIAGAQVDYARLRLGAEGPSGRTFAALVDDLQDDATR